MTTTDSPINLEIESQHSPQQSATPRTSTGIILATAVVFTLVGATATWGYQKMTATAPITPAMPQEQTIPVTTGATPTPITAPITPAMPQEQTIPVTTGATPTPIIVTNETLQKYTSATNSYTFSYPQTVEWKVFVTPGGQGESVAVACEACTDAKIDMFQVTPVIFTSIEEYLQKDTLTIDKTVISLNGLPAVRGIQSGSEQAGGSFLVVFIVKDGKGYLLQQRYAGLFNKTKFSEMPQAKPDILSSFKFSE